MPAREMRFVVKNGSFVQNTRRFALVGGSDLSRSSISRRIAGDIGTFDKEGYKKRWRRGALLFLRGLSHSSIHEANCIFASR